MLVLALQFSRDGGAPAARRARRRVGDVGRGGPGTGRGPGRKAGSSIRRGPISRDRGPSGRTPSQRNSERQVPRVPVVPAVSSEELDRGRNGPRRQL